MILTKISDLAARRPVILQFLRFACIGLLNTALDFLVLNTISKALGITQGIPLGVINFISFTMAVIQSYLWNRTWTFGSEVARLTTNVYRLVLVGALGAVFLLLAIAASKFSSPWYYYFGLLIIYLVFESFLWRMFGFHLSDWNHESHSFMIFFIVTFIGLAINVSLVSYVSVNLHLTQIADLDKNIAKVIATAVSLFWNFAGYKLIVFRK